MLPPLKHLVAVTALFALVVAQVFGLQRGYLCDCGGEAQQTAYEHCHGPHSEACHDHDMACAQDEDDHADDNDTHHHPPITESLQFSTQKGGVSVPVVLAAALVMSTWDASVPMPEPQESARPCARHDDRSPPECLRVARTVVLLI